MAESLNTIFQRTFTGLTPSDESTSKEISDDLAILFEGRMYKPSELQLDANSIDMALKTTKLCKTCMGIEKCYMPIKGWQVVYNDSDSKLYGYKYPCFRYRQCAYGLEYEKTKKMTPRQATQTFSSFSVLRESQAIYDKCYDYARNFSKHTRRGLLLMGNYGTGKTHMAMAILHEILKNGIAGVFVSMPDLVNDLIMSFKTDDQSIKYETALTKKLVIIDDLGAERLRDWVKEYIYRLINTRYLKEMPMILTTNLSIPELEEHIGKAAVDRLIEICDIIPFEGPSWRRRK